MSSPEGCVEVRLGGARLLADPSGALVWPEEATVIVADLHLEKGSAIAGRGALLPPYDTRTTIERLAVTAVRHRARRVVCLGDSFHDRHAAGRMGPAERAALAALTARLDWVWIAGNHDPEPEAAPGGRAVAELRLGPLVLRHAALPGAPGHELSGHYHPKALVATGARRLSRRCFVGDARRMILPAFGSYAGGLDVSDPAIAGLFPRGFAALLLGRDRLFRFSSTQLDVKVDYGDDRTCVAKLSRASS